jgi:hypothetical protein
MMSRDISIVNGSQQFLFGISDLTGNFWILDLGKISITTNANVTDKSSTAASDLSAMIDPSTLIGATMKEQEMTATASDPLSMMAKDHHDTSMM